MSETATEKVAKKEVKPNGRNNQSATVNKKVDRKAEKELPAEKEVPVRKIAPELTVDQKIQKVSDLTDLIEKRSRLLDAQTKLNSFDLKREDSSTNIELADGQGNLFSTYNPSAIKGFISATQTQIAQELEAVEDKIRF